MLLGFSVGKNMLALCVPIILIIYPAAAAPHLAFAAQSLSKHPGSIAVFLWCRALVFNLGERGTWRPLLGWRSEHVPACVISLAFLYGGTSWRQAG